MDLTGVSARIMEQPLPAVREAKSREPVSGGTPTAAEGERKAAPVCDEYVPEDKSVKRSAGLYRMTHDGDGSPRIAFTPPEDAGAPEKSASGREAETTTVNTDKVDREIEALKEEQRQLKRQLSAADPREAEALNRQLAQVERELRQKDNDAYRRQNAVVS